MEIVRPVESFVAVPALPETEPVIRFEKTLLPLKVLLSARRVEEAAKPELHPVQVPTTKFPIVAELEKRFVVEAVVAKKFVVVALVVVDLVAIKSVIPFKLAMLLRVVVASSAVSKRPPKEVV